VPGWIEKHPHDLLVRLGIGSDGTEGEELRLGRVEVGDAQAQMGLGDAAGPGRCLLAVDALESELE
jgi:hypothetical protein